MATHVLIPTGETTGKCSCGGANYLGAQTNAGMLAQHQNHLRHEGEIPGHSAHQQLGGHRQAWTQKQIALVDSWMDTHRIGREIEDSAIREEACRDLLDDLWDAKLLAGS